MPAPIMYNPLKGLNEALAIGGEAIGKRRQEQRQQQQDVATMSALAQAYQQAGQEGQITAQGLAQALAASGVPASVAQPLLAQVLGQEQKLEQIQLNNATRPTKAGQPSKVSQKFVEDNMKNLSSMRQMRGSLDAAREAHKGLQGPFGWFKAITSEDKARLETESMLGLQPILKIFNPSGAIATRKIEMLKDRFVISPWDSAWRAEGKFQTQQRMVEAAEQQAAQFQQLIEEYGENIPLAKIVEFERNAEKVVDQIIKETDPLFSESGETIAQGKPIEKLPPAKNYKGKIFKNPETGERVQSNGKSWVKVGAK